MKTRILSGVVMALMVAAVLALGFLVSGWFITVFVALIAAVAAWELLSAFDVRNQAARMGASVYSFLGILLLSGRVRLFSSVAESAETARAYMLFIAWSIFYFIFAACVILARHEEFSLAGIAAFSGLVPLYCFAFSCLGAIIDHDNGVFYLLMLLNFSSVCDMGAYFVGSALGKHKLCPAISPKKTVEGAVGGMASSLLVTVILVLCFSMRGKLVAALLLTLPLCVLSMIGDLFASVIKRAAGIKDYGKLIPGHGGILDRVDSILMVAPLFYLCMIWGVLS